MVLSFSSWEIDYQLNYLHHHMGIPYQASLKDQQLRRKDHLMAYEPNVLF